MKKYNVSYNIDVVVEVEAENYEEAIENADNYLDDLPLQINAYNEVEADEL